MRRISLNKVCLIGNLGSDPERKSYGDDGVLARFSLATTRGVKQADGSWRDETDWHECTAWGRDAEGILENLSRGQRIYVEGELRTRKWEAEDGSKRKATSINVNTWIHLTPPSKGLSKGEGPVDSFKPGVEGGDDVPF